MLCMDYGIGKGCMIILLILLDTMFFGQSVLKTGVAEPRVTDVSPEEDSQRN